jgi:hypothetical protein
MYTAILELPPKVLIRAVAQGHHDQTGRFLVKAVEQPFSTFSIGVDTAAYTLMRNYMLKGYLPPAESVRTEEFVNFFDYAYKAPTRETFRVFVETAPSQFGHGLHLMKIGVKGRRLGREEQRKAMLTFLVDTSGSMDKDDRIGLVKKSLKLLVEKMGPQDMVAIVQERLALAFQKQAGLQVLKPPFATRALDVSLLWAGIHNSDPAHRWFRERLAETARGL